MTGWFNIVCFRVMFGIKFTYFKGVSISHVYKYILHMVVLHITSRLHITIGVVYNGPELAGFNEPFMFVTKRFCIS